MEAVTADYPRVLHLGDSMVRASAGYARARDRVRVRMRVFAYARVSAHLHRCMFSVAFVSVGFKSILRASQSTESKHACDRWRVGLLGHVRFLGRWQANAR